MKKRDIINLISDLEADKLKYIYIYIDIAILKIKLAFNLPLTDEKCCGRCIEGMDTCFLDEEL